MIDASDTLHEPARQDFQRELIEKPYRDIFSRASLMPTTKIQNQLTSARERHSLRSHSFDHNAFPFRALAEKRQQVSL